MMNSLKQNIVLPVGDGKPLSSSVPFLLKHHERFSSPVYGPALLLLLAACGGGGGGGSGPATGGEDISDRAQDADDSQQATPKPEDKTPHKSQPPEQSPQPDIRSASRDSKETDTKNSPSDAASGHFVVLGPENKKYSIDPNKKGNEIAKELMTESRVRTKNSNPDDATIVRDIINQHIPDFASASGSNVLLLAGAGDKTGAGDKAGETGEQVTNLFLAHGGQNRYVGAADAADNILSYAYAPTRVAVDLSAMKSSSQAAKGASSTRGAQGDSVEPTSQGSKTQSWADGDTVQNIDHIIGSIHSDTLKGDGEANRLDGGADAVRDTLTGGGGADVFRLSSKAPTIEAADLITDFGGADKLSTDLNQVWHEIDVLNARTILYGKGDGSVVLAVLEGVTKPLQKTDFEAKNASFKLTPYGADGKLKVSFIKNSVTADPVKEGGVDQVSENALGVIPALKGTGLTGNTFPSGNTYFRLKPGNGDDTGLFDIDSDSGAVSWKTPVPQHDHETKPEYSFTIEYVVGTQPVAEQTVTVKVEDLNDEKPVFTSGNVGDFELKDGTEYKAGTTVYTAKATPDVEGQEVTYGLKPDTVDRRWFDIDESGVATFALDIIPNHDAGKTSYSFTVVAKVGKQTAEQLVTLEVKDVNDSPTLIGNRFVNFYDGYLYEVADAVYTLRVIPDVATDDVVFSLKPKVGDESLFRIDSQKNRGAHEGMVKFKGGTMIDHETKPSYSFTIVYTVTGDDRAQTKEVPVRLSVTDQNDEKPSFTSETEGKELTDGTEYKAGTTVYMAKATPDVKGSDVVYSLKPGIGNEDLFDLDKQGRCGYAQDEYYTRP